MLWSMTMHHRSYVPEFLTILIAISVSCMHTRAQDITAQLSADTITAGFTVQSASNDTLLTVRGNGRVIVPGTIAIGTSFPRAALHVDGTEGFLVTGRGVTQGSIPVTGRGARLMWYPGKRAFRSGYAHGTEWDDANTGFYSSAFGVNTIASGTHATALGRNTIASGVNSLAMGDTTNASGLCAFAMGWRTTASGSHALATGQETTASGTNATAMGSGTVASGAHSTALGIWTTASGSCSTAMGKNTIASGSGSTAIGTFVSTDGKEGAFIVGDRSVSNAASALNASQDNRFFARFANGFSLFTNSSASIGIYMNANQSSWSSLSDSSRKELLVLPDADSIVRKFRNLRLGSWNYRGTDSATERHYGPMAQEWFAAFGHDGIGTVGDDTTLASADVDGVLCIAVQALEMRTATNHTDISALQTLLNAKDAEIKQLRSEKDAEIAQLHQQLSVQQRQCESWYTELVKMIQALEHVDHDDKRASLFK